MSQSLIEGIHPGDLCVLGAIMAREGRSASQIAEKINDIFKGVGQPDRVNSFGIRTHLRSLVNRQFVAIEPRKPAAVYYATALGMVAFNEWAAQETQVA